MPVDLDTGRHTRVPQLKACLSCPIPPNDKLKRRPIQLRAFDGRAPARRRAKGIARTPPFSLRFSSSSKQLPRALRAPRPFLPRTPIRSAPNHAGPPAPSSHRVGLRGLLKPPARFMYCLHSAFLSFRTPYTSFPGTFVFFVDRKAPKPIVLRISALSPPSRAGASDRPSDPRRGLPVGSAVFFLRASGPCPRFSTPISCGEGWWAWTVRMAGHLQRGSGCSGRVQRWANVLRQLLRINCDFEAWT